MSATTPTYDDATKPTVGRPSSPVTAPRPDLATPAGWSKYLCLDDFEAAARRKLPRQIFGSYSGAAETNQSRDAHLAAFRRNPTIADAIMDRLAHNAYRIELTGESLRKRQSQSPPATLA